MGLTIDELHETELGDFLLLVGSHLLMESEKMDMLADNLLPHIAIISGHIMESSGNMKKSFDSLEFAKGVYPSERVWGPEKEPGESEKDYEEERAKLEKRFNLPTEEDKEEK